MFWLPFPISIGIRVLTFNRLSSSGLHAFTAKSRKYVTPQIQVTRKNIMFFQLWPSTAKPKPRVGLALGSILGSWRLLRTISITFVQLQKYTLNSSLKGVWLRCRYPTIFSVSMIIPLGVQGGPLEYSTSMGMLHQPLFKSYVYQFQPFLDEKSES